VRRALRGPTVEPPGSTPHATAPLYERLYEELARDVAADESIGGGDFDLIGRLELGVLVMEGLRPGDTLVDLGCGTGRLAVHAIPWLERGRYIGIDISQTMLDEAQARVAARRFQPVPATQVQWLKQTTSRFALPARSVDRVCAFSVFTHMEAEDNYRYLTDALRIIRPGGRFVLSCLPLDQIPYARDVFLASASDDFETRWSKVRSVATSTDAMEAIARLAGWSPLRWYPGDQPLIRETTGAEVRAFGQSVLVLEAPTAGSA
jgi:SAM-dependent methyltransferase